MLQEDLDAQEDQDDAAQELRLALVFGDADREPYQAYNVPLDRIVSEVCEVNDMEYIPAPKGFYQEFFKNIITTKK